MGLPYDSMGNYSGSNCEKHIRVTSRTRLHIRSYCQSIYILILIVLSSIEQPPLQSYFCNEYLDFGYTLVLLFKCSSVFGEEGNHYIVGVVAEVADERGDAIRIDRLKRV